jgi:hypothetical protein
MYMALEILVLIIHNPPGSSKTTLISVHSKLETDKEYIYPISAYITLLMVTRIYMVIILITKLSHWRANEGC